MVKLAEGKPILVDTKAENNFKLTKEEFLQAITPNTKAVIINSPANPIGTVYSKEELEVIGKIAIDHQIYIISDEIYEKLIYDNNKHISIASIDEKFKEWTILINGLSKT